MFIIHVVILYLCAPNVYSLSNQLFTLIYEFENISLDRCVAEDYDGELSTLQPGLDLTYKTLIHPIIEKSDPWKLFQSIILRSIYGQRFDEYEAKTTKAAKTDDIVPSDSLAHYPLGNIMRSELYQNKSTVHLPSEELMHKGHCYLKVTEDFMQTAVDAFAIILYGNVDDILQLPRDYVLQSSRTISMMKISHEKLTATWTVVKENKPAEAVTYETLELYRPLFRFLCGKEMSKLNLSDDRILNYIGTYSQLDRHQVGVVASRYVSLNPNWQKPKYLNLMNNLLCGIPMTFMRRLPENTYLQLTHHVFYHIRACDPLQRRFYLAMMTRTQALGKSYSWNARDVARLGLLLTEVEGSELSAVVPEAMAGITAQVMLEIPPDTLKYLTDKQLRYIKQKPLNILAKKMQIYQDQNQMFINSYKHSTVLYNIMIYLLHNVLIMYVCHF